MPILLPQRLAQSLVSWPRMGQSSDTMDVSSSSFCTVRVLESSLPIATAAIADRTSLRSS
jgi:hypothetical protein